MVHGDGNGWATGPDGLRRWGRHGAAGLLLRASTPAGPAVLLQHRAVWSHQGGTWGLPGGARDSHESTVDAAVREAGEETGLGPDAVAVRGEVLTSGARGGWTYTTVVADAPGVLPTTANEESEELRWVAETDVDRLRLHPGLAASWPSLRTRPVRVLVDTANVLGSRPDGWWRDRAGATTRLLERLAAAFPRTVALPDGAWGWVAEPEVVLEGVARGADAVPGVTVHLAPGSGDDEVVARAAGDAGRTVVVVTADRGLRGRLRALDPTSTPSPSSTHAPPGTVAVLGPGELLGWLDEVA